MDEVDFVLPTAPQAPGKLPCRFYIGTRQNPAKTEKEGRPIFDEIEMIEIRNPGSRDNFHAKVDQRWINEYPQEYKYWKDTQRTLIEGTPIEQYPKFGRGRIMELKALGILSCEQFMALTDSQIQKSGMGVRNEIKEMTAWMQAAKDSAIVTKQAAEIQRRDDEIADLKRQIGELATMMKSMKDENVTPITRGRKVQSE
jgi:hypothetical protein